MDNSVTEMASQKLVEGLIEDIAIGKELMSFPEESGNETRKEQDPMDSLSGQPFSLDSEPHVNQTIPGLTPPIGNQTMLCGKETWEYKTLFANQAKLADQLADTPGIAVRLSSELFAHRIIEKVVRDAANIGGVTEIVRVQPILTAMLAKVDLNPKRYYDLRAAMLAPNVGVDPDVVKRFVPERGPLGEPKPKIAAPAMSCALADRKRKKCKIKPQCRQFVELILKLSGILGSDALALGRMKLSLAILKGQDESTAIDPEVYHDTKTVQEFFEVMSEYWPCYTDHDLLAMVIEATENKEAIDTLECFLQSKDPRSAIPVAKCPDAPFWSACSNSDSDAKAKESTTDTSTGMLKGGNGVGDSPQAVEGKQKDPPQAIESKQNACSALQKAYELPKQEQKMTLQMISSAISQYAVADPINSIIPADRPQQSPTDPCQCGGKDGQRLGLSDETAATKQKSSSANLAISDQQPQPNSPDPESGEALVGLEYRHNRPVQSHELPPKRVPVVAEVSLESITYSMYNCLKGVVASVLKTPREAMCLSGAFKGSCIIVWHVSEEIAAGIKRIRLTPDDQARLLQCAIMKMSCGEECLFSVAEEELQEIVTSGMVTECAQNVSELEVAEEGEIEAEMQGRVRAITSDKDFERELQQAGESLVVVDFKTDWCMPSFVMNPRFAALSEQYPDVKFLSIDAEECEATSNRYHVDEVPTFAFFRKRQLLHQVVGADMQAVEFGILQAESAVPGQMSLNSLINKTSSECLNENDSHPFNNVLTANKEYLESDCDEQLIISLTFQIPVKLHTLKIVGPPDGRAPKRVKLFTNQIHTLDFDSAERGKAVQEFDLTEEDVKQDSLLSLNYVKFQNVQNLTIFIQDNQGGEETTVVNHLGIFGTPLESLNMEYFQRVSGVKGEVHVKGYSGCW